MMSLSLDELHFIIDLIMVIFLLERLREEPILTESGTFLRFSLMAAFVWVLIFDIDDVFEFGFIGPGRGSLLRSVTFKCLILLGVLIDIIRSHVNKRFFKQHKDQFTKIDSL